MPVNNEHHDVFYCDSDGERKRLSDVTEIHIDTDGMDADDLAKIRDRSALTVTVSLDDDSMRWLKRLVDRGIRRKKKHLMWKRGRRYMRRWRRC